MIVNDTLDLFLRIKLAWRQFEKHPNLAILNVDCVRSIHESQEPHLTLPSGIGPLTMDNGDH